MPIPAFMPVMGQVVADRAINQDRRDDEDKKSVGERVKNFLQRFDPRDKTLGASDLYGGNPYG